MIISSPIVDRRFYRETYTEEATRQLCRMSDLAPPDWDTFRENLEHSAAVYRRAKAVYSDLQTSTQQRRQLNAVSKAAKKLVDATASLAWQPELAVAKKVESNAIAAFFVDRTKHQEHTTLISFANEDGSEGHAIIGVPELMNLVRALEHAATDAAKDLPKSRAGKKKAHGIGLWISNIADIWAETTDQPFTRDVASDGEPVTNAARFCVGAFQLIEQDMDKSLVLTAMKHFKARQNARTGRNSSKKES